jgi:nucleotide-binding universal stress UspA family protein
MTITKLLVGIDSSPESRVAQRHALHIARRTGAELLLAHATGRSELSQHRHDSEALLQSLTVPELWRHAQTSQNEQRGDLSDPPALSSPVIPLFTPLLINDAPDPGLARAANERDVDLVVVGTHGRSGIRRALLGSVAERTIELVATSALVARCGPPAKQEGYNRVLVATDFSANAEQALRVALALACATARVDLLHCWPLPIASMMARTPPVAAAANCGASPVIELTGDDAIELALAEGNRLVACHRHESIKLGFELIHGRPVHAILERLRSGAYDLCAVGSRGHRGLRRLLLGSVAQPVVRHAPCSVLVSHA